MAHELSINKMECQICFYPFNFSEKCPLELDCGHSICKSCAGLIYSKYTIKCPFDRKQLKKKLQDLNPNFALLDTIHNLNSSEAKELDFSRLSLSLENQEASLVCSVGHPLKNFSTATERKLFMGKASNSLTICQHCGLTGLAHSYSCSLCQFDLCERCISEQLHSKQVIVSDQALKCPNDHLLFTYNDYHKFSLRKNSQVSEVQCKFCFTNLDRIANACKLCSFQACDKCCEFDWIEKIKKLKSSNPSKFCLNGHELQMMSEISEESAKQCSHCFSPGNNDFMCCDTCSFFLCKDCFGSLTQVADSEVHPEWLCKLRHPLVRYQDTVEFYKRKFQGFQNIVCHTCGKSFLGPSWSCRVCSFDLCLDCQPKANNQLGWCFLNHPLKVMNLSDSTKGFTCSVCKLVSFDSGVWCEWCRYIICGGCSEYFKKSEYLPVTCYQGHALVHSKDQLDSYQVRFSVRLFVCNGCKAKVEALANYHCRRCEFDLCDTCYNTILFGAYRGIKAQCNYNHDLQWCFNTPVKYQNSYYCDYCSADYKLCGSFNCTYCQFDVCVRCAFDLVNRD